MKCFKRTHQTSSHKFLTSTPTLMTFTGVNNAHPNQHHKLLHQKIGTKNWSRLIREFNGGPEHFSPEEEYRTVERGGKIEGGVSVSLAGRALAEVADDDEAVLSALKRVRGPHSCTKYFVQFRHFNFPLKLFQLFKD